ncbi:hypothetical protein [Serratia fonticola]|uniref:hypothetical protein n=1 Tax=Serratia fonticola TaxID=47917 RepID=UPI00093DCF4B|nr:hypothetical protein [Serratia fonticola]OKP31383.1 hypothetical protein BSQ40_00545 [Serratia fonticola]
MKNSPIIVLFLTMVATLLVTATARSAVGDIILWPIVTSAEFTPGTGKTVTVHATVDMIPIRQTRTDSDLNTEYNNRIVVRFISPVAGYMNTSAYVPLLKTWKEISDYWLKTYGRHTVLNISLTWAGTSTSFGKGGCVGIGNHTPGESTNMANAATLMQNPGANYPCTNIPVSAYRCNIMQSELAIDFGRINTKEIDGKEASINFDLSCDGPATISLTSTAGTTLTLGTGITAALTFDDKPLSEFRQVDEGNTVHKLSAKISAPSVKAGSYSYSTALIFNYQ